MDRDQIFAAHHFHGFRPGGSAFAQDDAFARVIKTHTLNCGYYTGAPYFDIDPNTATKSGITYEIAEAVGRELGLKINWGGEIGLGDATTALDTNKIDAMCVTLWASPPRLQTMLPVRTEFFTPARLFARPGDHRFDGNIAKANAKGVRISAIDGDFTADLGKALFPQAQIVALPQTASISDVLLQVSTGKADLVTMDLGTVNDFNKHNAAHPLQAVVGVPPVRYYNEHIWVRNGEYKLQDMMSAALEQLINNGAIDRILTKYNASFGAEHHAPVKSFDPAVVGH